MTTDNVGTLSRIMNQRLFIISAHTERHTPRMTNPTTYDAYIADAPEAFHAMLARLRTQLAKALPDAAEVIKYDMPGFQIGDTIVAGYAAFAKQCGLYVDPSAIAAHADAIAALRLKATKAGVTFSAARPISDDLVAKLAVRSRKAKGL
jgi:uncharacterized protein YdhG (YjbR/CyaY superfamily)